MTREQMINEYMKAGKGTPGQAATYVDDFLRKKGRLSEIPAEAVAAPPTPGQPVPAAARVEEPPGFVASVADFAKAGGSLPYKGAGYAVGAARGAAQAVPKAAGAVVGVVKGAAKTAATSFQEGMDVGEKITGYQPGLTPPAPASSPAVQRLASAHAEASVAEKRAKLQSLYPARSDIAAWPDQDVIDTYAGL